MLVFCAKECNLYANLTRFVNCTGISYAESRGLKSVGRVPRPVFK